MLEGGVGGGGLPELDDLLPDVVPNPKALGLRQNLPAGLYIAIENTFIASSRMDSAKNFVFGFAEYSKIAFV